MYAPTQKTIKPVSDLFLFGFIHALNTFPQVSITFAFSNDRMSKSTEALLYSVLTVVILAPYPTKPIQFYLRTNWIWLQKQVVPSICFENDGRLLKIVLNITQIGCPEPIQINTLASFDLCQTTFAAVNSLLAGRQ